MSLSANVLWQAPTVDDVEDFFGADYWSLSDFVWAAIVIVVAVVVSHLVVRLVRRALRRFTRFEALVSQPKSHLSVCTTICNISSGYASGFGWASAICPGFKSTARKWADFRVSSMSVPMASTVRA
jgi:hypothetical protein